MRLHKRQRRFNMDSVKHLEHLFSQARTQSTFASCDEVKEQFQHSSTLGSSGATSKIVQFLLTNKWIFMLVTISTTIALLILSSTPSTAVNDTVLNSSDDLKENSTVEERKDEEKKEILATVTFEAKKEAPSVSTVKRESEVEKKEVVDPEEESTPSKESKTTNEETPKAVKKGVEMKESPRPFFPKLTEKEIAANNKRKKKMMKKVATFSSKVYTLLPSSSFVYKGDSVSVQSFFMQKTEVSNIQYKTFLFDLLIKGKKDDFQIAKPEQQLWTEMLGSEFKEMEDNYFSGEDWENYPVVNVSREGALLYCKWLSEERRKFTKSAMITDFRIPTKVEWTMAASAKGKMMPYPWGGSSIQNEHGCYLANFDAPSSVVATQGSCDVQSDGAPIIAETMTYNPNEYGLFNMSGNVAEMVQINPSKNSRGEDGTAGGGWMNSAEEIKINGTDPYEGRSEAHPNIGFRVVITQIGSRL